MNAQLIIQSLSGIAVMGALLGGCVMLAEARAKAASRRWWRDRDPLWVDSLSAGATVQMHDRSDLTVQTTTGRIPLGKAASDEAGHPSQSHTGATSFLSADRPPAGFISKLHSATLRRVA